MAHHCPHREIRFCPLYHAMHVVGAPSCDDGKLERGSCGVERGIRYHEKLGKLNASHPYIVAYCEWMEVKETAKQQMQRNMELLKLH